MAEHLRGPLAFRRAYLRSGQPISGLKYRAPGYPLTPILGFALCLLACIGLAFDPEQRIALLRAAVRRPVLPHLFPDPARRAKPLWENNMSVNNPVARLLAEHPTLIPTARWPPSWKRAAAI